MTALLTMFALLLGDAGTADAGPQTWSSLQEAVDALGGPRSWEALERLRKEPRPAIALLARSLHPVPDETLPARSQSAGSDVMKMVWRVRALRCLTRRDLFVPYRLPRPKEGDYVGPVAMRRDLLAARHGGDRITFFALHFSRGTLYLAPRKAQEGIVSKWQQLAQKLPATLPPPCTDKELDEWYY